MNLDRVLRARSLRMHKLSRALLRRLRSRGFDAKSFAVRAQLGAAVLRLDDLVVRSGNNPTVLEEVITVRTGLLGVTDQIEAMSSAKPRAVGA